MSATTSDEFRTALKEQIIATDRGPFTGWWEGLLEYSPHALEAVHLHVLAAENGPIPEVLRHLIWVGVDSVVTHLYPRGIGVHERIAMELGASTAQVLDALRIASTVSTRGYGNALPVALEEIAAAGASVTSADPHRSMAVTERLQREFGEDAPEWMSAEAALNPEALEAFLDLAPDHTDSDGLDQRSGAIIALAAAACPAIADERLTRMHARRALQLGATGDEILHALRLANTIGMHSMAEGVAQLQEVREDPT